MQAYQAPHSLAGELLGASYVATFPGLLLLPLPRDCPEPGRSEMHQADAAAASHSSQLSSPPAPQSSEHSAAGVPETATTPLESRDSAAPPGSTYAPAQRAQQGPEVPHAAMSISCGLPAVEAHSVRPAMAQDIRSAWSQPAAAVPVALPIEEHLLDSWHAGMEDVHVHGQGQHAGSQQIIGTAPAPLPGRGISRGQCSGREAVRQARCAVLVPCCEAVHGRFPLNGTYFQTNEVFLDASSLERPVVVSHCGSPETQLSHKKHVLKMHKYLRKATHLEFKATACASVRHVYAKTY